MTIWKRLTGLFRRFRSLVLRNEVEVAGQCGLCGACCQNILIKHEGRWLRRKKDYDDLIESLPAYARFRLINRDEAGYFLFTCDKLGKDNFCEAYEDRPSLCRNYPTKSLYYQGVNLRVDCGYYFKAKTFRDVIMHRKRTRTPAFSKLLERELEREDRQE